MLYETIVSSKYLGVGEECLAFPFRYSSLISNSHMWHGIQSRHSLKPNAKTSNSRQDFRFKAQLSARG